MKTLDEIQTWAEKELLRIEDQRADIRLDGNGFWYLTGEETAYRDLLQFIGAPNENR